MRGITSGGFAYEFDPAALDDMRIVELLGVVTGDETADLDRLLSMSKLTGMLLGEAQKEALYAHIAKDHGGRVPFGPLEKQLSEIMAGAGEQTVKN